MYIYQIKDKHLFAEKQLAKDHFCPLELRLLRGKSARKDMIQLIGCKNKIVQPLSD